MTYKFKKTLTTPRGKMEIKSRKQYFAIQKDYENFMKQVCPELKHQAGIYFYIRTEEDNKFAYIGKSVDCMQRCISHHLGRKQPIDNSIHKRGYYDTENNSIGWKLSVLYFTEQELNEKERYYIDLYKNAGYTMYNIESGGTIGKTDINERKPSKTYKDGVEYGREKEKEKIQAFFKYLDISVKGASNKIKERKLKEFMEYLGVE